MGRGALVGHRDGSLSHLPEWLSEAFCPWPESDEVKSCLYRWAALVPDHVHAHVNEESLLRLPKGICVRGGDVFVPLASLQ